MHGNSARLKVIANKMCLNWVSETAPDPGDPALFDPELALTADAGDGLKEMLTTKELYHT